MRRARITAKPSWDGCQGDGRHCRIAVGPVARSAGSDHDIAVAFDNPIHSFRNDLFPPYKSDEGVPPELRAQFDTAEHAVSSIGVTVWSMREYEVEAVAGGPLTL
jgi:5'-3' exonuclease